MAKYERLNAVWKVLRGAEKPISAAEISAVLLMDHKITTTPETVTRDLELHYEATELAVFAEGKWSLAEGTP